MRHSAFDRQALLLKRSGEIRWKWWKKTEGVATLPKGFLPIDWQENVENPIVWTQIVEMEEERAVG